jgi:hypothetical protein
VAESALAKWLFKIRYGLKSLCRRSAALCLALSNFDLIQAMASASQSQKISPGIVVLGLLALFLFYLTALSIHRLYFSPLAKFPGPRLAALTKWYEFYYEVVLNGKFTFEIRRMHEIYGEASSLLFYQPHEVPRYTFKLTSC